MSDLYIQFTNYVHNIIKNKNIDNFKSNNNVTYMLEHVSFEQGQSYLQYIKDICNTFTEDDIIRYCKENDKYGGGVKYDFGFIVTSPSNFRYILHAHLILTHMKSNNMNDVNIVEVGCGYGGLCLAIHSFSKLYNINILCYNLIDLPDISNLQKMYLSNFNMNDLTYHSSYEYGANITNDNLFLISNYCFSEISDYHQKQYIKTLFPKVIHGFMAWNCIPVYDFGCKCKVEDEYPLTGPNNKYLFF